MRSALWSRMDAIKIELTCDKGTRENIWNMYFYIKECLGKTLLIYDEARFRESSKIEISFNAVAYTSVSGEFHPHSHWPFSHPAFFMTGPRITEVSLFCPRE